MTFDFASRFKTAFGFVAGNVASRLMTNGFGDIVKKGNDYGLTVYNGMDVSFDEVTLKQGVNGPAYLFAYRSMAEDYNNVFATPPMLRLSRDKRLVVSVIDNSDLEVVERYSTEPWEITFRGLLIDMVDHEFPLDKLETINEIFEVNSIWTVSSEIINAIGVEALYIKDIKIEFVEGFEDTIAYTMTTRAIKPLEYQLIKK
jgi:hypothetical protein